MHLKHASLSRYSHSFLTPSGSPNRPPPPSAHRQTQSRSIQKIWLAQRPKRTSPNLLAILKPTNQTEKGTKTQKERKKEKKKKETGAFQQSLISWKSRAVLTWPYLNVILTMADIRPIDPQIDKPWPPTLACIVRTGVFRPCLYRAMLDPVCSSNVRVPYHHVCCPEDFGELTKRTKARAGAGATRSKGVG